MSSLVPGPQPRTNDVQLLIVDDNATNRAILEELLDSWGIRHASADGAITALELLANAHDHGTPFTIGLVDMQMPGTSGLDLVRKLHQDDRFAALRIIMLTSLGETAARAEGLPQWVERVLVKPVRQAELAEALQGVLSASTQRVGVESPKISWRAGSRNYRLLLVEDNPLNQEVMRDMMDTLGFSIDVAENGRVALEMLAKSDYSLVLMDCQMPVLDGYEATRELRRLEHQKGDRRTPVIAVTAHAFSDEHDKVLQAGMDDYLTKPVQLAALRSALDRWLSGVPTSKILAPGNIPAALAQQTDVQPMAAPAPQGTAGDRALLNPSMRRTSRMRELFASESPKDINFIAEADVAGETDLLRQRAHRLKGASYAFGAELLGDLAAEIERQIKTGQTDVADLIARLEPLFQKTVLELERITQIGRSP